MKTFKLSKILKTIYSVFIWFITSIAIIVIIAFVCGIKPYAVVSGSMEPSIHVGSICFVNRHAKYENLKKGDIITFKIGKSLTATHRVYRITKKGIETKGDANYIVDDNKVTKKNLVGKVVLTIPKIGFIFRQGRARINLVLGIIIILVLNSLGIVIDKKQ